MARVVRRLTVCRLTTLAVASWSTLAVPGLPTLAVRRLSTLLVGLAALLRRPAANKTLCRGRRAWIGRGCCRPGFAVPVPEETLSAARIGIPPRVRAHGPILGATGVTQPGENVDDISAVDHAIPEAPHCFEDRWLSRSRFVELAPELLDVLASPHWSQLSQI